LPQLEVKVFFGGSLGGKSGNQFIQYAIVLFIAITLNFMLPRLMPGNPLVLLAGVDVGLLSAEERAKVVEEAGLDKPMHEQYVQYWVNLAKGDFGYSYRQKRPINDLILDRLPWTLLLTLSSLIVSAVVGIVVGATSAWKRGSKMDILLLNAMIFIRSMPSFWIGMMLISMVSVKYGLLPSQGALTPAAGYEGFDRTVDIIKHAILPIVTLSILTIPRIYLTMRYTMLSVLGEPFIRTARSKGLRERTILFRHMIPNALIPVVTVLALRFGFAFGGTVVIETVFSYPGLGRLIFEAVSGRDYPVMQASFLLFTLAILFSNLFAEWLYPRLDPRARNTG
jgi:peptide/nickel transport system permease protein